MAQATRTTLVSATESLAALLKNAPAGERREKALYQLDRLQQAVQASHQEAVRFAAFTVNKTVHDAADEWGPGIVAAMETLRAELAAHGHEF
jgi:deferrochelatase/peroxidase EfeB